MARALLVLQKNDHSLGYYDLESGAPLARVALDPYPHEFALDRAAGRAYCCHFGVALAEDEGPGGDTVSVVDIAAGARIGTLSCGPYRRPHGIALDGSGRLYVPSEAASRLLIAEHGEAGRFERSLPTGGAGSHWVSVTRDGHLAFVSNMVSGSVTALFPDDPERPPLAIPVGARPEGSLLDAGEERLYVVNRESAQISVIEVATLRALDPIATAAGPVRICWDDRRRLLVPLYHDRSLATLDPAAPGAATRIALPERPVAISYDAELSWAFASTLGDRVQVIDIRAGKLLRSIATAPGPDPTAVVTI